MCFRFSLVCVLLPGMSAGRSIWDRLFSLVLVLLVIAGLLGAFLWYQPVIQENQRMRRDKLELEKKIEKETETARKLEADLRALQNPATVERLARERLSYAKPGKASSTSTRRPAAPPPSKGPRPYTVMISFSLAAR